MSSYQVSEPDYSSPELKPRIRRNLPDALWSQQFDNFVIMDKFINCIKMSNSQPIFRTHLSPFEYQNWVLYSFQTLCCSIRTEIIFWNFHYNHVEPVKIWPAHIFIVECIKQSIIWICNTGAILLFLGQFATCEQIVHLVIRWAYTLASPETTYFLSQSELLATTTIESCSVFLPTSHSRLNFSLSRWFFHDQDGRVEILIVIPVLYRAVLPCRVVGFIWINDNCRHFTWLTLYPLHSQPEHHLNCGG